MKKLSLKSLSTFQYLFFTLVLLLVLLGLYRYSYIPNRIDYFTDRNLRLLSNMSTQLSTVIESYKGQIDKNFVNTESSIADELGQEATDAAEVKFIKDRIEQIQGLTYIDHDFKKCDSIFNKKVNALKIIDENVEVPLRSNDPNTIQFASLIDYQLSLDDKGHFLAMKYWGKRIEKDSQYYIFLEIQASLPDIIAPFLKSDVFENILLVENTPFDTLDWKGRVIYQAEEETFLATRLDTLSKNRKETWASFDTEVDWGNKDYHIFVQPVRIALVDQYTPGKPRTKEWMLVGLVDQKIFNAQARQISPLIMAQGAFVFFIFLFSIPFIKLYFIGAREELRAKDVLQCTFSFFILTGLITFWILSIYSDRRDRGELDDALVPLAESIESNLEDEIRLIVEQSKAFSADSMLTNSGGKLITAYLKEEDSISLGAIQDMSYPYFNQFSWIDRNGMQKRKISTREYITPLVNVAQRAYFKKIRDKQSWKLNKETFYIEPIISITTGENVAALTTENNVEDDVLTTMMAVDLMSLANPVFPKGFGYCIMDEYGEVLFHSTPEKNMWENFFVECNDAPRLKASVLARMDNHMTVNYQGREHRIYTKPFKNIPEWTLVTFADLWMVRSAQLNVLSSAALLFLVLALWIPVLFILMQSVLVLLGRFDWSRTYTWFWPSKEHNERYKLHSIILFGLAGFYFGLIFMMSPFYNLLAALILPTIIILPTFLLLNFDFFGKKDNQSQTKSKKQWRKIGAYLILLGAILISLIVGFASDWSNKTFLFLFLGLGGLLIGYLLNLDEVVEAIGIRKYPPYYVRYTLGAVALLLTTSLLPVVGLYKISHDAEKEVLIRTGQYTLNQGLKEREKNIQKELADKELNDVQEDMLKKKKLNYFGAKDIYYHFYARTFLNSGTDIEIGASEKDQEKDSSGSQQNILIDTFSFSIPDLNESLEVSWDKEKQCLAILDTGKLRQVIESVNREEGAQKIISIDTFSFLLPYLNCSVEAFRDNSKSCLIVPDLEYFKQAIELIDNKASLKKNISIATFNFWLADLDTSFVVFRNIAESRLGRLDSAGFQLAIDLIKSYAGQPVFSSKTDKLFAWLRQRMAIVHPLTWEMHKNETADSLWQWNKWQTDTLTMLLLTDVERKDQEHSSITNNESTLILSFFKTFTPTTWWLCLLTFAAISILLFIALLYYNHQVFGINLILPFAMGKYLGPVETIHQNTIYIGYPNSGKSKEITRLKNARIVDLTKLSGPGELWNQAAESNDMPSYKFLVIDHFDLFWQEKNWNPELLALMEELISKKKKKVVLVTTVDPTMAFSQLTTKTKDESNKDESAPKIDAFHQNRWIMLLSNFTKTYHQIPAATKKWAKKVRMKYASQANHRQMLDTLIEECQHTPLLQETGLEVLEMYEELDRHFPNEEALIDEILLRAEAFYESIWSLCSVDEKITLVHLARNQFVPYKDAPVVRRLMRKGLVSSINYRLLNKSFAAFVQGAVTESKMKEWKKHQEKSWESIRTPLITFIIAILAFTFVTQREIFNTSIAWITTIGALIPTILRIMSFIGPRTGTGEAAGDDG
jgi:hypothetical protein